MPDPLRKTMENPLKNSSLDIFQALEEYGLVHYLVIGQSGIIVSVNHSLSHLLGYLDEDLVGRDFSNIVLGGEQVFTQALSAKSNSFQATLISRNDVLRISHFSIKTLDNQSNQPTYLLMLSFPENPFAASDFTDEDDTELVKYKKQLLVASSEIQEKIRLTESLQNHIIDNEVRLRHSLNAINDGIWEWNIEKDSWYFSDRFFTMLGYDPFEYSQNSESWLSLVVLEDQAKLKDRLTKLSNGLINDFSLEYRMVCKSGVQSWILSKGSVVETKNTGKPARLLGTHIDISHLKENELSLKYNEKNLLRKNEQYQKINEKLSESSRKTALLNQQLIDKQSHLSSILKTVPASITLISDSIILYANNYTSLMTGFEQEELLGHHIEMLFKDSTTFNQIASQIFDKKQASVTRSITATWRMKEGTLIDVYITATQLDSDIASNAFTISAVDISAQRLYEEELINAKERAERAERLKVEFLNNMSHELRTPMNGIIGFAEMLRETTSLPKRDEYLKVIINSSKQLLKIITDIIEISKIESGEVEMFYSNVNLSTLFAELYENYNNLLVQRGKDHINFIYEKTEENVILQIQTDELKLRYILNCLLMNAIKFTEQGSISFGYTLEGDYLRFFVNDTGIGIDASEKEAIFESFRQSDSPIRKKYGGNGLGLSIAKGFTQVLGGKIYLESVEGEGTKFNVKIPYRPETITPETELISENMMPDWKNKHILVVEDDLTCFALIEELLEETGIDITHAATGLEAVKVCRKDNEIQMVLMDMRLPEMDGYEATKRIKEFRPELPIIAQTAHAFSEDRKKCITAGCNDYITKPLEQEKLLKLIDKYLNFARV